MITAAATHRVPTVCHTLCLALPVQVSQPYRVDAAALTVRFTDLDKQMK